MFLTVQQKILLTLLRDGPLQNSQIAKRVGITEQHCSNMIGRLFREGLIESEVKPPRIINKLTKKGVKIAEHLKEISENVITQKSTLNDRVRFLSTLL